MYETAVGGGKSRLKKDITIEFSIMENVVFYFMSWPVSVHL